MFKVVVCSMIVKFSMIDILWGITEKYAWCDPLKIPSDKNYFRFEWQLVKHTFKLSKQLTLNM